ncbi:MAG: Crp/Fnr family transcriptional regulator [Ignavibacteria bacterium]|jgi:CRP-like cAMP-binding protein|nr:Crp/Fnr family transcriptional regulator [Ignavibacteria bacterium]
MNKLSEEIINKIAELAKNEPEFLDLKAHNLRAKTMLLLEGKKADEVYYVKSGCIRAYREMERRDYTDHFYFSGEVCVPFYSFFNNSPSLLSIETIEPSLIISLPKVKLGSLCNKYKYFNSIFHQMQSDFLGYHILRCARLATLSIDERHQYLIDTNSQVLELKDRYVASYIGADRGYFNRVRNDK